MLGHKIIVILTDNFGYACITRLQKACGGAPFNNMLEDCLQGLHGAPRIDFAANARSLGADAETVGSIAELGEAMKRARASDKSYLDQHRHRRPAEHSRRRLLVGSRHSRGPVRPAVVAARQQLDEAKKKQRI